MGSQEEVRQLKCESDLQDLRDMWPDSRTDKESVISFLWFCGLGVYLSASAAVK